MCGIAVIAGSTLELTERDAIDRMVNALSHRGPDAASIQHLQGCYLGHRRLSIIDLEGGSQPLRDATARYWIVLNGEIYNYRELRSELGRRGYQFLTDSDTEVLLTSYIEWGRSCLDRLRGMFAFSIWDSQERTLFAARDLFGEKPLYFARLSGGRLLVSSELKGLIASRLVSRKPNAAALDAYLAFGYVPPDRTAYEGVDTLPPGHLMTWRNGQVKLERYWAPQFEERAITLDEAAQKLGTLLEQAVGRQMTADVPVGAFLSGGLDSSTIVALMRTQSRGSVLTFSAGFGEYINELPFARAVATKYATRHCEVDFGAPNVAEMLRKMVDVYDEPFADSSSIPTFLLSQFASGHVKVVLAGDGGDELFGGYGWYPPLAASEHMAPSWAKWLVLGLFARLLRGKRLKQSAVALGWATRFPDMWTRNFSAQMVFRPGERSALWGGKVKEVFQPGDYYRPRESVQGLNRCFHFDLTSYLPGDILVKVDRAAMANGLETRAPFLDRDVVEFALSLPANLKVNENDTKIVLRHACGKYWPEELRTRGKQGFGAPYKRWLGRSDVAALVSRVFSGRSSLRRLLPGIGSIRPRTAYQTWVLLVLGLWLERNETAAQP